MTHITFKDGALFDLVHALDANGLLGAFDGSGQQHEITIKVARVVHDTYSVDVQQGPRPDLPLPAGPPPWTGTIPKEA